MKLLSSKTVSGMMAGLACLALAACSKESAPAESEPSPPPQARSAPESASTPPRTDMASAGPLCDAHAAPANLCFICDASLREKDRLWCREHDRYEDRCWLCHPEIEDKDRLWCKEHSLYEDECFLCHPELKKTEKPASNPEAGAGRDPNRLWCNEHGVYEDECTLCHPELAGKGQTSDSGLMCPEHGVLESECGICHPELASQLSPGQGLKIRFLSSEAAGKVGIRTEKPRMAEVADAFECYAELSFNQNRLAEITPLVEGIVKSVAVDLGSRVEAGDLLATMASIPIAEAQGRFLRALAGKRLARETQERERRLREKKISSLEDLQQAEAAYESAQAEVEASRQHLLTLGFSESQAGMLATERKATGVMELRAPFDGEIVERSAVQGAFAQSGRALFQLADLSTMWAMLTFPESRLSQIRPGQQVRLQVPAYEGETFAGKLTWISAGVDPRTRMARARAEIDNFDRRLRAHMFATAQVLVTESAPAAVLPDSAIQWLEDRPFAFVRMTSDLYMARPLLLGPNENGLCSVLDGLKPDDEVVTQGSFAVKSQFLISRLGAGCVHE